MNDLTTILKRFPLEEILESYKDIPFGNTDYQIENFIINASLTPERAFRAVGLNIRAKINALRDAYYGKQKTQVDIEELQEKIDNPQTNKFDRRRAEIDLEQKLSQKIDSDKMIADAIHEVEVYYNYWKVLPHPTREEFEFGEEKYFAQSLNNQVNGIVGAQEAIKNIGAKILDDKKLIR